MKRTIILYLLLIPAAIATTYIWGVGPHIVVIEDGYDVIVNGPPPRATPRPGTPRPATPKPATPKPATPRPSTPKPASAATSANLDARQAVSAIYAQWAQRNPSQAMQSALTQPDHTYAMRVAQVWDGLDRPAFEAWYLTIQDVDLRKCIALAIPASRQIDPNTMRAHPDFAQLTQSWAIFTAEQDPARVQAFALTVAEPLRGLLLEIVEKVQP